VASYGTYNKVGDLKKEDREAKKERKAAAAATAVASERREVEKFWEHMPDLIAEKVQQKLREIIPDELWEGLAAWNAAGRRGPLVVPSISDSNSIQHVSPDVVTPDTANVEEAQPAAAPAAAPVPPPAAANTSGRSGAPSRRRQHERALGGRSGDTTSRRRQYREADRIGASSHHI
jgi:hypothetical protein